MTAATLLTQTSCRLCEQAKDVLKRVAAKQTLDISEVSLDDVAGRELASRHGVLFAPGLLLDDEFFSYGRLSERKLRRELQRRHAG